MLPRFQSKFNLPYVATAFGVHHFQVEGQVKSVRHAKAVLSTQCHQQEHRSQLTSVRTRAYRASIDSWIDFYVSGQMTSYNHLFFLFVCPLEFSQIFYKRILAESIWLDPIQVPDQTKRVHKRKIQNYYQYYYQLDAQKLVHWKINQRHQMYISVSGYPRQIRPFRQQDHGSVRSAVIIAFMIVDKAVFSPQ